MVSHEVDNHTKSIVEETHIQDSQNLTGIILGAGVYPNGNLSPMLKDRVDTTIELYKNNKITKILVSGDHGRKEYDEVNAIKDYLLENNVPKEDIFLDHAGFDTYDSMYRAKYIFEVSDAVIITNEFHLPRALYIADKIGIDAVGVNADKRNYPRVEFNKLREKIASIKAYLDIKIEAEPTHLGPKIPITSNSLLSWDEIE